MHLNILLILLNILKETLCCVDLSSYSYIFISKLQQLIIELEREINFRSLHRQLSLHHWKSIESPLNPVHCFQRSIQLVVWTKGLCVSVVWVLGKMNNSSKREDGWRTHSIWKELMMFCHLEFCDKYFHVLVRCPKGVTPIMRSANEKTMGLVASSPH